MITENLELVTLDEAQERLVSPAPVLITEQEVAFGTAVALRTRPTTRRRWIEATHVLLAPCSRALAPSMQEDRPARRDYPKHYAFLENACMAREMDRLNGREIATTVREGMRCSHDWISGNMRDKSQMPLCAW